MRLRTLGAATALCTLTGLLGTPSADAATTSQMDIWADFQKPAPWASQADDLHWYVEFPVLTPAMVGKVVTVELTSPGTIDCEDLGAGQQKGDAWTNVTFTVKSCSGGQAVVRYKVTKALAGGRVFVNGWSSTTVDPASVAGSVQVGRKSWKARVTATHHDAVVPVAPGTVLGTWQGKTVSLSSEAGVNQVWVGGRAVDAPAGQVLHSSLANGVVTLWTSTAGSTWDTPAGSVDRWSLDLSTMAVSTQQITGRLVASGDIGFLVDVTPQPGTMYTWESYTWDGTRVGSQDYVWTSVPRVLGFTPEGYVLWWDSGSRTGGTIQYQDLGGHVFQREEGAQLAWSPEGVDITNPALAPDGATYDRYMLHKGVTEHCHMTAQAVTCTPA